MKTLRNSAIFAILCAGLLFTTSCGDDDDDNKKDDTQVKGAFSVSATKKVVFSVGNLQYKPSTKTWRFAEHQYDCVGLDNAKISDTYDGWIDLFGWGTWIDGGNPVNTSATPSDYTWDSSKSAAIGSEWVALTKDEWNYIKAHNQYGVADVNGVNGVILLPDEFTMPDGITFKNGVATENGAEYFKTINSFTLADWSKLEAAGAVFLPTAGHRTHDADGNIQINNVNAGGATWTPTTDGETAAYGFGCFSNIVTVDNSRTFDFGFSVRLVKVL
jgi:hypothetical protein